MRRYTIGEATPPCERQRAVSQAVDDVVRAVAPTAERAALAVIGAADETRAALRAGIHLALDSGLLALPSEVVRERDAFDRLLDDVQAKFAQLRPG